MGPDWYWVAVFALGGLAIGFITTLVGLPKGREFLGWLLLYAFMVTSTVLLDLQHPFWTVLVASLIAGLAASLVQTVFMPIYRRKNPWYAQEMEKPTHHVALGFAAYALFAGAVFGVVLGGLSWLLSYI